MISLGYKPSTETSNANKIKMREIFNNLVSNGDDYKVVYGFDTDVTMGDFLIVKSTTYTYSSFIIGYSEVKEEIIVIVTDPDLSNHAQPVYIKKSEIIKASYSSFVSQYNIRDDKLPKRYIQFCIPGMTDDPKLYVDVLQEQEMKDFEEFFQKVFVSPSDCPFCKVFNKIFK